MYLSGVDTADPSLSGLNGLYLQYFPLELTPGLLTEVSTNKYGQVYSGGRPVYHYYSQPACSQYIYHHNVDVSYWIVGPQYGINKGQNCAY